MEVVPFGKYKGQPVEVLANDKGYCEWLMSQGDFLDRYGSIKTLIINNFKEPEDTPDHNRLQAMFLDDEFCSKLANLVFVRNDKYEKMYYEAKEYRNGGDNICSIYGRVFEEKGIDVYYRASSSYDYDKSKKDKFKDFSTNLYCGELAVEIKPDIGDDYPSILRQIKSNSSWEYSDVLVYEKFNGIGVTEDQFRSMYKQSKVHCFRVDEIK